jgi:long-chain acyl-CoA synthetase
MAVRPEETLQPPWVRFYDPGVPARLTYPDHPVHHLLEAAARRYGPRPALVFFGRPLSYAALDTLAARFAAGLQRLGVEPGTPVSLHLPNCPQFVIAYYGILKAGGVAVPHNPLYTEREVAHQLQDAGVRVAVTLDLVTPAVLPAARRAGVRDVVVTSITAYMPPLLRLLYPLKAARQGQRVRVAWGPGLHQFAALFQPAPLRPVAVRPDDPAQYQYTGGTTGTPQAAVLTHRNLVANVTQVVAWNPRAQPGAETAMAVLPFFHIYGLTAVLNAGFAQGQTLVLIPRFDPRLVLQAVRRHRPTYFHGVPTMYMALLAQPALARTPLGSIRACISGAMALPVAVQQAWEARTGGRLVEGYGLTEASPVTHCNPVWGHRKPGSIGIPLPDTEARIVDPETAQPLPPGEVGELAVRGPQVMAGYLGRPEATARALRDGWLLTGDMARMDEDGFFYLVDRKKEMINVGGLKVFPREVEEVLYEHPAVREAAAVGIPDRERGERVKAFVALKPGAAMTEEALIAHCRARLAPHKVPRAIEVREALPKSLIGKVLRRVLAEEARAGDGAF